MLNKQIRVTTAAQEGARIASFGADPTARAEDIAGTDIAVTLSTSPCSAPSSGDAEVTVTHNFTFVTPVGLLGIAGPVTLTGRGVTPCQ